jgi:hypothetical protein
MYLHISVSCIVRNKLKLIFLKNCVLKNIFEEVEIVRQINSLKIVFSSNTVISQGKPDGQL